MKLSEVMRETGLTKKAIYYYEEEGLIHPQKSGENQYRNYDDEDIQKLMFIHILRKLDFSMKDIQPIVQRQENFAESMTKQLARVRVEMERLSNTKDVLETFVARGENMNADELMILANRLDSESKKAAGYMVKELDRILPGNLGKLFAIHYNQFLEGPLDTKEKEDAWKELIQFLDSCEEIQYPEHIKKIIDELYGQLTQDRLDALNEKARTVTDKILAGAPKVDEATQKEIKEKLEEYQKTTAYQNFLLFQQFTKDKLQPIFEKVDQYVSIISPRYEAFHKILQQK